MFRKILVAVDGSESGERALKQAAVLAKRQETKLVAVHVLDGMPAAWSHYVDGQYRPARVETLFRGLCAAGTGVLTRAREIAATHGVEAETALVHAKGRSVARAILDHAAETGAELLVLATRGREGLARLVGGSDAEEVVRRANVPVLLVRCPALVPACAAERALHAPRPRVHLAA